ncbi:MAG: hypothetical protein EB828_03475 [Nitrosopumilus sp. D6]|nr:MAG: hypothetical protein EB828_03475 [Nitrosopumilus sp. D6]
MRNDERYEIERAFDLLPHVVGASWASVWFRMTGAKKPSREEYRTKTLEFLKMIEPVFDSYPDTAEFAEICKYVKSRQDTEYERITAGDNGEIEKRYDRYVDYG